jgi:hypothetical protein
MVSAAHGSPLFRIVGENGKKQQHTIWSMVD